MCANVIMNPLLCIIKNNIKKKNDSPRWPKDLLEQKCLTYAFYIVRCAMFDVSLAS
jgi:hypothetical protein